MGYCCNKLETIRCFNGQVQQGDVKMRIKDFEVNFKVIRKSQGISCQRKKELFITFLLEIEEVYFKEPEKICPIELQLAEIVYREIQEYLIQLNHLNS